MEYIFLGISILLVALLIVHKNYRLKELKRAKSEGFKLCLLCPVVAYLLDRIGYFQKSRIRKCKSRYVTLFPNEDVSEKFIFYNYQKFSIVYITVLIGCIFIFAAEIQEGQMNGYLDNLKIKRPDYGSRSNVKRYDVTFAEGNHLYSSQVEVVIPAWEYTEQEIKQKMKEAKTYIQESMPGENESLKTVYSSLNLVAQIPNTPIEVSWGSTPAGIVNSDGTLNNKDLESPRNITMKAKLSSGEQRMEYEFVVRVFPYNWSWEERTQYELQKAIEGEEQNSIHDGYFSLPAQVGNVKVKYAEPDDSNSNIFLVLVPVVCVLIWLLYEEKFKGLEKRRVLQMQADYPDLVNKLTLLIGAGMTIKRAWYKITSEYSDNRENCQLTRRYVYEEMLLTIHELENGMSEAEAYERFGQRIKLKPYLRLVSLLTQNLRKGSKGLLELMHMEAKEAMEERKQLAKQLGEEAGTKLLIPMILMLAIVLVIVMVPAMLSMS